MGIKIPKLKSRYIPVYSASFKIVDGLSWWDKDDEYIYPNILLNLDTINKEDVPKMNFPDDMFLLCDSGGFQAIRGTCNYDWETSLIKQIELNSSKIFSFDIPPVKRKNENSNDFLSMTIEESKKIVKENFDVGLKQSKYLKENYSDKLERFCYIAQCATVDLMFENLRYIKEVIGLENYSEYFPGGIVLSCKGNDLMLYAMCAMKFYLDFIKKGTYVHSLGIGSMQRMALMIRNEITTFDSSNVLRGAISWDVYNPITPQYKITSINKHSYPFEKNFCTCPTCLKYNFNNILKENDVLFGRTIIKHNLWYQLSMNIFLDSIKKERYTEMYSENFKCTNEMKQALDFCDYVDKVGFDIAYEKYKVFLKKDTSKQGTLF